MSPPGKWQRGSGHQAFEAAPKSKAGHFAISACPDTSSCCLQVRTRALSAFERGAPGASIAPPTTLARSLANALARKDARATTLTFDVYTSGLPSRAFATGFFSCKALARGDSLRRLSVSSDSLQAGFAREGQIWSGEVSAVRCMMQVASQVSAMEWRDECRMLRAQMEGQERRCLFEDGHVACPSLTSGKLMSTGPWLLLQECSDALAFQAVAFRTFGCGRRSGVLKEAPAYTTRQSHANLGTSCPDS